MDDLLVDNDFIRHRHKMRNEISNKKKPNRQQHLPTNLAAMVFGVYLSAQAAYRLDGKSPRNLPLLI